MLFMPDIQQILQWPGPSLSIAPDALFDHRCVLCCEKLPCQKGTFGSQGIAELVGCSMRILANATSDMARIWLHIAWTGLLVVCVVSSEAQDSTPCSEDGVCHSAQDLSFAERKHAEDSLFPAMHHFPMLLDNARNAAYHAAIRRAVASAGPEARVLDIGSGSGLLAMMAAAANIGPHPVVGVERNHEVAKAARWVLADNGLQDKVVLLRARSSDVQVTEQCQGYTSDGGPCMPARANILVSEVLATDLFGEGWNWVLMDARARLITRDALVIPRRGVGLAQAIFYPYGFAEDATLEGFDLKALRPLRPDNKVGAELSCCSQCVNLTDVVDMEEWDFAAAASDIEPGKRLHVTTATASGVVNAVALWWKVQLLDGSEVDGGEDVWLSSGPGQNSHWQQYVFMLHRDIPVKKGDQLQLALLHNAHLWWVSASPVTSDSNAPTWTVLGYINHSPVLTLTVYEIVPSEQGDGTTTHEERVTDTVVPNHMGSRQTFVGREFVFRADFKNEQGVVEHLEVARVKVGPVRSQVVFGNNNKAQVIG
jgi:hypothetical protein